MRRIIAAILLSTCLYAACSKPEPVCYEPLTVTARVQYIQRTLDEIDTLIGTVLLDTFYLYFADTFLPLLNARNLDTDTFGVVAVPNTGALSFYLNPNSHSTTYAIRYDTVGVYSDTISFYHNSYPVFISNDCGYTHYFSLDSILYRSPFVDSLFITNKEVTLDNANNANSALIYFFKTL